MAHPLETNTLTTPAAETAAGDLLPRIRAGLGFAALTLAWGIASGTAGLAIAADHEADLSIAGTPAQVETTTENYNQLSVDDKVIQLKVPAGDKQRIAGQQVGVKVNLDVDLSQFITPKGTLNTPALTAYASLFSDPKQIESEITTGLAKHDGEGAAIGAAIGMLGYGAYRSRRAWLETHGGYRPPLTPFQRRAAVAMALTSLAGSVPSSAAQHPAPRSIPHPPSCMPMQRSKAHRSTAPRLTVRWHRWCTS